ncbi:MAG: hypothetical protein JWN38_1157 [Candidatus Saccharibacteria bacterium]|nr:hypothetical protein [Candidatus Saccharibacteria bacterium]
MAKVLLVEDDNNLREIYEARLQAEGYDIVTAHDGEEALVVAKAERPDLIISDVMMPKISGFEMLDILRNTDGLKDVKVIMLTALGQADDQQRADRLGADRYLVKSQVTLEDIVKVAQHLLGQDEAVPEAVAAAAAPAPAAAPEPAAATPAPVVPAPAAPAVTPVAPATPPEPAAAPEPATPAVVTPDPVVEPTEPEPATPAPTVEATTPIDSAAVSPTLSELEASTAASTASEEADVQAQIIDFEAAPAPEPVAVEPTPTPQAAIDEAMQPEPESTAAPAPEPVVAPATTPDPAPATPAATPVAPATPPEPAATPASPATNDQVMAEAVQDLSGDTPLHPNDGTSGSGHAKKIVAPLDTPAQPDINELLAREEAKEIQAGIVTDPSQQLSPEVVTPAPPSSEDQPSGGAANPGSDVSPSDSGEKPFDPNSIAL